MKYIDNIIHAMYCQAVADAVGDPFEFKSVVHPVDVIAYANTADVLEITDDTQMLLHGMIAAINCTNTQDASIFVDEFRLHYIDWYLTQIEKFETYRDHFNKEFLMDFGSMYKVKSPGTTCMTSMYQHLNGLHVKNNSKGCGSVMRLLPLVLVADQLGWVDATEIAKKTGAITHGHSENDIAITQYMKFCNYILDGYYTNPFGGINNISELGEGWTALECVEMAYWAYINASDFDELLELSISHSGDSDSVAAIAGSFWGLNMGHLPHSYKIKLDAQDAIDFVANKLTNLKK